MSLFEPRIPRDLAVRLGQEAVAISETGMYVGPGGPVEIGAYVMASLRKTRYYGPDHAHQPPAKGPHQTRFEVTNETTLSAHRRHQAKGHNVVSLNFASATHPGGGFLSGARAQEEYLCRSSALYLTIKDCAMYGYHRAKGDCLYSDAMIYSPDVPVFRDDEHALLPAAYHASFITSAAPLAKLLRDEDFEHLPDLLDLRIKKILSVALHNGHDSLILGAWGCGAFGNDGHQVAGIFHANLTSDFAGAFKEVTFAIVDTSPEARFITPFAGRFASTPQENSEKPALFDMREVKPRTDAVLRKHFKIPRTPYDDLNFHHDLGSHFQECDSLRADLSVEFPSLNMDDAEASRIQNVRQLYLLILERLKNAS